MNTMMLRLALVCILAVSATAQQVQITPLDNNTSEDDFAPAYTNHGRMIVLTHDNGGSQQLYSMERSSNGWEGTSKLRGTINDGEQVGVSTITPDGQFMIFSAFKHDVPGLGRTDLYSAKKVDGSWEQITNLGPNVNSAFYDSQPTLSADGRTLYFVSDRTGGQGGTDIYMSTFDGTTWSAARPVKGINTANDEMSPVIGPDGKTMYFSSNRSGGQGGFDVYVGTVSGDNVSSIKVMQSPINTAADEMFYTALPNSNQAFFSRTTSNGDYDNFMAVPNPFPSEPVTLVEGIVSDATTKDPLGADITITDLSTGKAISSMRSDDRTGQYFVTLTPGKVYSITARKKGYLFHSERFEVPPGSGEQTIQKDIALSPLAGGGDQLLVFFDYDKTELKSESIPELERVIELLRDHPEIKVVFEGHTDDQGADDYNDKLSQRRAESVRDYVITGGVDKGRVAAKGFGKRKPLVPGSTDDARAKNRRVEMRVQ